VNKELHPIKTFRKSLVAYFTNLKNLKIYFNREKIRYCIYTIQTSKFGISPNFLWP